MGEVRVSDEVDVTPGPWVTPDEDGFLWWSVLGNRGLSWGTVDAVPRNWEKGSGRRGKSVYPMGPEMVVLIDESEVLVLEVREESAD